MTEPTYEAADRAQYAEMAYLGQGCTRNVFLEDGWVYKVNLNAYESIDANALEYDNYLNLRDLAHDFIRIPRCVLFDNGVLAMEFVEGDDVGTCYCTQDEECRPDCLSPEQIEAIKDCEVYDISYGNVIRREGLLYIIDMVC